MKFTTPIIIGFSCLLACSQAFAAGKVYKWVDKDGVTHYGATPPLNTQTEVIKPNTGHSDPVNYATPTPSPNANSTNNNANDEKAAFKDKEQCELARKNQQSLKTYSRIKVKGDNGEYRFLTPDEQKQKLEETDKVVEKACE